MVYILLYISLTNDILKQGNIVRISMDSMNISSENLTRWVLIIVNELSMEFQLTCTIFLSIKYLNNNGRHDLAT